MRPKDFKVVLSTWAGATRLIKKLAGQIKGSGFKPDIIVGIGRGGLIPARLLSDLLLIENVATFQIKHYWLRAGKPSKARIATRLSVPLVGKRVLLVDDITDTGQTLSTAHKYVSSLSPAQLKTAVLEHKAGSKFQPDFYAHKIVKWRWVTYPWALHEDLVDLVGRISKKGMSKAAIAQQLRKRFGVRVKGSDLADFLAR